MPARTGHVVLFGSRRPLDQFAGVPQILRDRGVEVFYERLWDREMRFGHHANPEVLRGARAVAFADLSYNCHIAPTRLARAMKIPTVLLVDGVVEHANTMCNPWMGLGHLRAMPQDTLLAMGPLAGRILSGMDNRVVTTGLPRLDGFEQRIAEARTRLDANQWLVVATANTPAMDGESLGKIRSWLQRLHKEIERKKLPTRWRVHPSIAERLGVSVDDAPLTETLAGAIATITTPSTLAVESMLARVPTAIANPAGNPLWVPAAWVWQRERPDRPIAGMPIEHFTEPRALLDVLLGAPDLSAQCQILDQLHTPNAAEKVARAILDAEYRNHGHTVKTMASVWLREEPCHTLFVAMCDHANQRPPIVDTALDAIQNDEAAHLLCVGLSPLNFLDQRVPALGPPRTSGVVLDPTAPTHERAQAVLDAALALNPKQIILDDDRALPLAARLVARGVRCDDARLATRNDHVVRTIEQWPWAPQSPADESAADSWFEHELRQAGYHTIAYDAPATGCDAVLVRAASPRPHPSLVEQWRAQGLGVAVSPNMYVETGVYAAEHTIDRLITQDCARIAVAHSPERSPVLAAPIRHGAPIIGWLDDIAAEPTTHMGLPAHAFDAGVERLRPDAILVLHEEDLPRCRATGLPTELVNLDEALTHQPDHRLGEPVHRESLAHPGVDGG